MAIRKASDVVLTGNIPLPKERYICRGNKAKFKISNNDNPQIVWECEIAENKELEVDGKKYQIAGARFSYFLPLSEEGLGKTLDVMSRLELADEIDDEEPDTKQFENIVFEAVLGHQVRKPMKPHPTERGKMIPIKDAAGKEITQGYQITAMLDDILGRSTVEPTAAY